MNRSAIRIACLAAALLQAGFAQTPACGGHGDRNTMIVTTSWLADHLKDPNLVILSVGQKADYGAATFPARCTWTPLKSPSGRPRRSNRGSTPNSRPWRS